MTIELTVVLIVLFALSAYIIRSQRAIGNKVTEAIRLNNQLSTEISKRDKTLKQEISKVRGQLNLLKLSLPGVDVTSKKFILSLTSHPARFAALAEILPLLRNQILTPEKIVVNIAESDAGTLPQSIRDLEKSGFIELNFVEDLGPGKKLIPTLNKYSDQIIIAIDDDLYLTPDLTLQLILEHILYPTNIIASRVHQITYNEDGSIKPFSEWKKAVENIDGPSHDLMATSGAGTLFPPKSLHADATNVADYKELAFHTDDLWWHFQAQRIGTQVRRLPGHRPLEFVPETQDQGLWRTGNKDRNDENLIKLIKKYGAEHGNK